MNYTLWTKLQHPEFLKEFQLRSGEGLVHLEADSASPLVRVHTRPDLVPCALSQEVRELAKAESLQESKPRTGRVVDGSGCSRDAVMSLGKTTQFRHANPEVAGDFDRLVVCVQAMATVENGASTKIFGYAAFNLTAELSSKYPEVLVTCEVKEAWIRSKFRGIGSGQLMATGIGMSLAQFIRAFDEAGPDNRALPPTRFKILIPGFAQSQVMDAFLTNVKNGLESAAEHMHRKGGGHLALETMLKK